MQKDCAPILLSLHHHNCVCFESGLAMKTEYCREQVSRSSNPRAIWFSIRYGLTADCNSEQRKRKTYFYDWQHSSFNK